MQHSKKRCWKQSNESTRNSDAAIKLWRNTRGRGEREKDMERKKERERAKEKQQQRNYSSKASNLILHSSELIHAWTMEKTDDTFNARYSWLFFSRLSPAYYLHVALFLLSRQMRYEFSNAPQHTNPAHQQHTLSHIHTLYLVLCLFFLFRFR